MKDFGTRGKLVAVLFALTTMLGCGALDAGTPAAQSNTGLVAASPVVDFGSVPVGTTEVRANTIVNNTRSSIVLTSVQIDQSEFKITGQALPLTLAPGQRVTVQIAYSPQNSGGSISRIVLASNVSRLFSTFTLRGTATQADRMKLNPTSISFGKVPVGQTQSQSATLSNSGRIPLIVTRATISGKGFTLTGLNLPLTLEAGQSATMGVNFTPQAGGATSGTISVVGSVSTRVRQRPISFGGRGSDVTTVALNTVPISVSVPVSGTGMAGAGQLAVSPTSLALGSVRIGASQTQSATLINSGSSDLTIRQATVSGRGFRMSGLSFPMTLAAGQRKSFSVTFAPQAAGSASGSIAVTTDASNSVTNVPVSAVATAPGALSSNPSSLNFGTIQVGKGQTLSAALTNTGGSSVTVSQANLSGSGFTLSGVNLPVTLAVGQSTAFSVAFNPQSVGSASGALSFANDVSGGALTVALAGNAVSAGSLVSSPASLNFGNVQSNTPQTVSETLTNSGGSSVTVSQANITGSGFAISGLTLPATLAAGQSTTFSVTFTPQSGGAATGSLAIASNASNSTLSVPLAATVVTPGSLVSAPSTLNFGSVQLGTPQTVSETLTNSGGSSVTVSQANITGSGFALSGLTLPATLAAGQSTTFSVTFTPQSGGAASGSLAIGSSASNSTLSIPLTATVPTAGSLNSAPSSLNFGNVQLGTPKTVSETLTNSGGSSVTITQANFTGTGFSLTGLTLPATLAAGQSTTFNVTFTPQSGGAASGSLALVSNASNPTLGIPLTGNAAAAGLLSTSDSSLTFGSVQVGNTTTQSETLTNTGGSNVIVSQAKVSGTAFSVTGLNLPLTLIPGQSFTFATTFTPASGGSATGSISVVSDASDPALTITLAGTATVAGQLAVSPATLNFGTVTVGQTKSMTASLTASGSSITVSSASPSTSEFTMSGLTLPLTLAAGQSASFTVTFKPQSSGAASASGSFNSNAANPSVAQSLSGTGAAAPQHSVSLTWNSSTSTVVGYNVYRGTTSGGPYSKLASLNPDTSFVDSSVQSGQTYFYVTTAVDGSGKESANSNQTQAAIPTP